jgi:hypothetical protein
LFLTISLTSHVLFWRYGGSRTSVASIVTLLSATTLTASSLTRLWGLRGTPLHVAAALNELNDFKATLALVQSTLAIRDIPPDVLAGLDRLLDQAEERLKEFDIYLKEYILRDENGTQDLKHLRLRRRARLKEFLGEAQQRINGLQQGLLSVRVSLVLALGVAQL